jgi:hypothetical protein
MQSGADSVSYGNFASDGNTGAYAGSSARAGIRFAYTTYRQ